MGSILYLQNNYSHLTFYIGLEQNKPFTLNQFKNHLGIDKKIKTLFKKISRTGELDPDYAKVVIQNNICLEKLLPSLNKFSYNLIDLDELKHETQHEKTDGPIFSITDDESGQNYWIINENKITINLNNIITFDNCIHIINDGKFYTIKLKEHPKALMKLIHNFQVISPNLKQYLKENKLDYLIKIGKALNTNSYRKILKYEKRSFKINASPHFGAKDSSCTWKFDHPNPVYIANDVCIFKDKKLEAQFIKELVTNGFYFVNKAWSYNGRFPEGSLSKLEALGWEIFSEKIDNFESKESFIKGILNLDISLKPDWFEIKGYVDFAGESVPLEHLIQAANKNQTVSLSNNKKGILSPEELMKIEMLLNNGKPKDNAFQIPVYKIGLIKNDLIPTSKHKLDFYTENLINKLGNFKKIQHIDTPDKINIKLRDYQKDGLSWLNFLKEYGFGGILADDMGLGKTGQIISFIQHLKNNAQIKNVLIVVPKSLIFNWENEILKFTNDITIEIYHGSSKINHQDEFHQDILITTYHTLRNDLDFFLQIDFDLIVLDESHAIKNHQSGISKAVRQLKAKQKICMTGTPVENHLGELWSQFDFIMSGILGSFNSFQNLYIKNPTNQSIQYLKSTIYPFLLRRKKEDVAKELPPKIEQILKCEMTASQSNYYQTLKESIRNELFSTINKKGLNHSKLNVLEGLLRLRQAACHPQLLKKEEKHESGKLQVLIEMAEEIIAEGHKILVFSQFTSMLKIIQEQFIKKNIKHFYLDGKTNDRENVIKNFQFSEEPCTFLISLKTGGVGLNLTEADYVFIFDPWWNPASEAQAIDRTYRIGQDKTVFAYKLISENSIEEKILKLQESKKELSNLVISSQESLVQSLTSDDLNFLFSS